MSLTAQVAVSDATMYYDKLYTYVVPASVQGRIFVGSMVLIPFGRGKTRPRAGVVIELTEQEEENARLKELYDVAPEEARLTEELLSIVKYLKQATFCTWFEAVKAVIPYGAQYKPMQVDGHWTLQKQLKRHTEVVYSVTGSGALPRKASAKQEKVLAFLADGMPRTRQEIEQNCEVTKAVLDTLVKYELLQTGERDKEMSVEGLYKPQKEMELPVLSGIQKQVTDTLIDRMQAGAERPALLHGVTGSGKTAVFLQLIQTALQTGKTALVLVPEIGLTPQMITQLQQAFGSSVAVQHSALSNTERLLQWRQIQRGEAQVVVGTRSAVFAPLENIGIIIVDEEQEHTYQSESSPRYDALEVARRRAGYHKALLLLASATPSIADYHAAKTGRYELLELRERYGNLPLPTVRLVDMREETAAGNTGAISSALAAEMRQVLAENKQVILLLNRRGYRTVGMCRDCGEVLKCNDCSVPMVYHKAGNRLLCHYCGHSIEPVPVHCPTCGGEMRYTGFGTQRLEEELAEKFSSARVLRMDLDSTGRKGAHQKMLSSFGRGEYDILVGTQMVAKGLDFEKVSLVGVIGIDSLLFSQGYRAYENVFSLVTQVVGRSGRAGSPGRALIQTVDPENTVLNLAAQQDYVAFYEQEIAFRKISLYPPFCSICTVGFIAGSEEDAIAASRRFGVILAALAQQNKKIPLRLLGPAPMNIMQVAGSYRYRLTLKCRNDAEFRQLAQKTLEKYNKEGWTRKANVFLDFHVDIG